MPTSTECFHNGRLIGIDDALTIRAAARSSDAALLFTCVECGNAVRPHRTGDNNEAHIEHFERNPDCSLSNVDRSVASRPSLTPDFDFDDEKAIEGYAFDRTWSGRSRNARIAKLCKERDGHTCLACEFHLLVNDKYIIECHHTKPLSLNGEQTVSLNDLVSLCPTCHRIAHTRRDPFTVDEIRSILNAL